jgi:hypothetical protein
MAGVTGQFYFSGHAVLETLVSELKKGQYALGDAEEVLLAGCSAGGIGTFHHTDWLADALPG